MGKDNGVITVLDLMRPFLASLPPAMRAEGERIIALESAGVLAWAVRSGYLLWMRSHPGEVATPELRREWFLKGGADFTA